MFIEKTTQNYNRKQKLEAKWFVRKSGFFHMDNGHVHNKWTGLVQNYQCQHIQQSYTMI